MDAALKCCYCHLRFTSTIKLVPECGQLICGECHDDIETSMYKCKKCGEMHSMPEGGLADVKALSDLIAQQPVDRVALEETEVLKSLVHEVKAKLDTLKSFDSEDHINAYCDSLEDEIFIAVESSILHLNYLGQELVDVVKLYRKSLLEAARSQ